MYRARDNRDSGNIVALSPLAIWYSATRDYMRKLRQPGSLKSKQGRNLGGPGLLIPCTTSLDLLQPDFHPHLRE